MTRANQRLDELLGELGQLPAEIRVNYVVKQIAKLIDEAEQARERIDLLRREDCRTENARLLKERDAARALGPIGDAIVAQMVIAGLGDAPGLSRDLIAHWRSARAPNKEDG